MQSRNGFKKHFADNDAALRLAGPGGGLAGPDPPGGGRRARWGLFEPGATCSLLKQLVWHFSNNTTSFPSPPPSWWLQNQEPDFDQRHRRLRGAASCLDVGAEPARRRYVHPSHSSQQAASSSVTPQVEGTPPSWPLCTICPPPHLLSAPSSKQRAVTL